MKRKHTGAIPALLGAALLLSACGASAKDTPSAPVAREPLPAVVVQSAGQTDTNSGNSAETQTGTSSGNSAETKTGTSSGNSAETQTGTSSGNSAETQTGTSSGNSAETQTGTSSGNSAETQTGTSSGNSAETQTGTSSGNSAETQTGTSSGNSAETLYQFSNRDLSGTWDASTAVTLTLNGASIACDSGAVTLSGSTATITGAGTYVLSGTLDNGCIVVDAGKEDKVQLVLNGVEIQSADFAAIYVKQADKVFVTLADGTTNTLSNGGTFDKRDENSVDAVIFSKDDLTLNGDGALNVTSPAKHGIVSKDDLVITGGVYQITAKNHALSGKDAIAVSSGIFMLDAGKDALHAENDEQPVNIYLTGGNFAIKAGDDGVTATGTLQIDGGTLDIAAPEGMEANYVRINDGAIRIQASDDGINASRKSGAGTPAIEINGGEVTVAVGSGDTDGIDTNGNLIITGGVISVTGNSAFDVDGQITFTGGSVTVNGQQVDTIPNQQFGRGGMGRNFGGQMPGNSNRGNKGGYQLPDGSQTPANGNGDASRTPADGNGDASRTPDMFRGGGKGGRNHGKTPDGITSATQSKQTV